MQQIHLKLFEKEAKAAGDLIDNKITAQSSPNTPTQIVLEMPKEKYILPEKRTHYSQTWINIIYKSNGILKSSKLIRQQNKSII